MLVTKNSQMQSSEHLTPQAALKASEHTSFQASHAVAKSRLQAGGLGLILELGEIPGEGG